MNSAGRRLPRRRANATDDVISGYVPFAQSPGNWLTADNIWMAGTPRHGYRFDSTRAMRREALTPNALQTRSNVSTVGDLRLDSSKLT